MEDNSEGRIKLDNSTFHISIKHKARPNLFLIFIARSGGEIYQSVDALLQHLVMHSAQHLTEHFLLHIQIEGHHFGNQVEGLRVALVAEVILELRTLVFAHELQKVLTASDEHC